MLGLLFLCIYGVSGAHAIISKCIREGEDAVTLTCPEGQVIVDPVIFVGVSRSGSCSYEEGDCWGLNFDLVTQRNKCFWQKECELRWRDQQPIVVSNNTACKKLYPNYVNMENPLCVPRGSVMNICDDNVDVGNVNHGVIRSHSDYPWTYSMAEDQCSIKLPARDGHRLVLHLQKVDLAHSHLLSVNSENGESDLREEDETFEPKGDAEVIFEMGSKEGGNGFILKFEYKPLRGFRPVTDATRPGGPTDLFRETLFGVGAIEECISPTREQLNITCPSGHVIYQPQVKVGVSKDGRCWYRPGDCTGMTHTFLTQRNVCYWKESCEFTWRSGIPITVSQNLRCLSQPPKYISLSGYTCLEEEKVVELCDRKYRTVSKKSGVIKSHSDFPWHYKAEKQNCRKRIRIPSGASLRMRTVDIDLDPDTKGDNVKFYHIKKGKKKLRRRIRGDKHLDETFEGGCVEIQFRISQRSKAGRGFVIKFESDAETSLVNAVEKYDDCSLRSTKSRRNKSRRSKRGRRRKNNKTNKVRRSKKNRKSKRSKPSVKRSRKRSSP